MRELVLPKFNNNDEACVLVAWMFGDGDQVGADEVVAEVETSKALEEVVAGQPAVLHRLADAAQECAFGQAIALLFDDELERQAYLTSQPGGTAPPADGAGGTAETGADGDGAPVLTAAARALAAQHGITLGQLRSLGKQVIKFADIEPLLPARAERPPALPAPGRPDGPVVPPTARHAPEPAPGDVTVELSRRQRAIAAVVTESHRTIPAAFAAVRADLTALARARAEGSPDDALAGPPEFMVKAIAAQRAALPMLFATLLDDRSVRIPGTVGVGVTIDAGTGLFIPVIREADQRSLADVAGQLMDFRVKALRQTFREEELAGASITLSLHNEPGIVMARPIVYPGQSAVVTLCGTEQEVFMDAEGRPQTRERVTIGLSYDHRVVNGREAVLFLAGVKRFLEEVPCAASQP